MYKIKNTDRSKPFAIISLMILILFIPRKGDSQVPTGYSDTLQMYLNANIGGQIPGLSASMEITGLGNWKGVSGNSIATLPIDTSMTFGFGHCTQTLTSVLCLKMAEKNIISLNDSLFKWLPNYTYVDSTITIKQLLAGQTGLSDYSLNQAFWTLVDSVPDSLWVPASVLNYLDPPLGNPGGAYFNSATNWILAGLVLESATGIPFHQLVRDSILIPLNMNSSYLEGIEISIGNGAQPHFNSISMDTVSRVALGSSSWASGAIVSTPGDMVKFFHAVFQGNFISGNSLLEMMNFNLGIWEYNLFGKSYWGYSGLLKGYLGMVVFDPDCGNTLSIAVNNSFIGFGNPDLTFSLNMLQRICGLLNSMGTFNDDKVEIYPNPTSDQLTINAGATVECQLSIVNSLGLEYTFDYKTEGEDIIVNTSQLSPGLYFLRISDGKREYVEKVLIK